MMRRNNRQESSVLPKYGNSMSGYSSSTASGLGVGLGCDNNYKAKNNSGRGYGGHYEKESYVNKKRQSYSEFVDVFPPFSVWLKKSSSWLGLCLAFFVLLSCYYQTRFDYLKRELRVDSLDQLIERHHSLLSMAPSTTSPSHKTEERIAILEQQNSKLKTEKNQLKVIYETKLKTELKDKLKDDSRILGREEALKDQIYLLKESAAHESRRAVTDKFGPGPHFVEFTFLMPSDENEVEHHFVVETAPLDYMPHAVHLFLEQVYHELWDSSWFYINGPHVLQAGPMLEEDEEGTDGEKFENDRLVALQPFIEKQLDSLAFPEYSEFFQHEEWTMGFTGRPGGPDWYINKQNNTVSHGPGGQNHYDLEEEADPCFAKVVKGFAEVKMIYNQATIEEGDDWEFFFWEPIFISRARVIPKPLELENPHHKSHNSSKHHHANFHKFQKPELHYEA